MYIGDNGVGVKLYIYFSVGGIVVNYFFGSYIFWIKVSGGIKINVYFNV